MFRNHQNTIEVGMMNSNNQIILYDDENNKTEIYQLKSILYQLLPTGIAICTYNTPDNLHALTQNQQWETYAILDHMKRDHAVRVAIWTGSGQRAFNAGMDLKNNREVFLPKDMRESMKKRRMAPIPSDLVLGEMTRAFWDFPKPSICAVNGMAVGGAANIALVNFHDLIVASTKAKFCYPFPKLGFTPELGSSYMMPLNVGMARAKEMMFLSDWFTAEQAKELGLVNRVVAPDELMNEAIKLAERLVLLPPEALAHSKKILNHHIRKQLDQILADELEMINKSVSDTGGPLVVKKWMTEQKSKIDAIKSKL